MDFYWSLSDNKSSQVSRTLLSILADLNNAVAWMVSARPLISKSFSPCTNHLMTVPSPSITIGIGDTFMCHRFFSSPGRSRYLSLFSLSFSFTLWSAWTTQSTIRQILSSFFFFFFFCYRPSLGLVIWPRLGDPFLKILQKFVCLLFLDRFWVVYIIIVRMVNFKFLAQFPVDHLPHPFVSSLTLFALTYFIRL